MPDIPLAGETLVKQRDLPGVNQNSSVNADTFGAAQGRAIERLGDTIGRAGSQLYQAMDERETRDAREAWEAARGDADVVTSEAEARKGVDVAPKGKPALSQYFAEKMGGVYGKHTKGLSEGSRAKFDRMWAPFSAVRSERIGRHQKNEQDAVDVSISETGIVAAVNDMSAAATTGVEAATAEAKARINSEANYIGKLKSLPPEVTALRISSEITKGHVNAVSALLAGDRSGEASAYFEKHQDEIDARVRPEVLARVQSHAEVTKAQEAAGVLFAQEGQDLDKALAAARKQYTGSLEEKVVSQLKARATERDHYQKQVQDHVYNVALKGILDPKLSSSDAEALALKASVDPERQLQLLQVARGLARAERGEAGNPFGLVDVKVAVDDGAIKTPEDLREAAAKLNLSKSETVKALEYQQQGGLTGEVKVSEVLALAKTFKAKLTGDEAVALTNFVTEDLKRTAGGKPVNSQELASLVAGYLASGETTARLGTDGKPKTPGWWIPGKGWNESALASRLSGNLDAWLPDIDDDEEDAQLRLALSESTKLPPSTFDEDTVRLFKKQRAGLKLGAAQDLKLPKPKKPAAPADPEEYARRRKVLADLDAAFNNPTQP